MLADRDLKDVVVWDIGGGSMQMTMYLGNGKYSIYKGKLASVSFKNHIIEDIQNKDISAVKSPNPINRRSMKTAFRDAEVMAKITVPREIQDKLQDPNTFVIGIGGVHFYSISKILRNKTYDEPMLLKDINKNFI